MFWGVSCSFPRVLKGSEGQKLPWCFRGFPWYFVGLGLTDSSALRWAKSRDSYRRIASESYRRDSNR